MVTFVRANEVVSTDRLFEVLWGAQPPESAANTLQTYVAHLRGAIEPDRVRRKVGQVLVTRQPGYMLAIEPDGIDAVRFERLAEQGQRELATAPADAARTLRTALKLWRGEALTERRPASDDPRSTSHSPVATSHQREQL